jgi:HAD superfamily hydrolase (TIGR01484 family)
MRFRALATDYDGTIATDGHVDEPTLDALQRLRNAGYALILVTGRELPDLQHTFSDLDLFDLAVVENGALLHRLSDQSEQPLADPPPQALVDELLHRGVSPFSVGRSIVATWEPHEKTVLEIIRDLGLEYHVIFNKGAVMVLPSTVTKATGLKAALAELGIAPEQVVGVGDAENDHAFLDLCGFSVAVANAIPALAERVDWVTKKPRGAGVVELVERLLADDLPEATRRQRK